ncbi:hypothetical protein FQZ97_1137800 [compost metagenome]
MSPPLQKRGPLAEITMQRSSARAICSTTSAKAAQKARLMALPASGRLRTRRAMPFSML